MYFFTFSPTPRQIKSMPINSFFIYGDRWDDHGYKTLYHLHYLDEASEDVYIGELKILKKGQAPTSHSTIQTSFDRLGENFCSLGQSLDYYERISKFGVQTRSEVLGRLNDIVFNPGIKRFFSGQLGYKVSMVRGISEDSDLFFLSKPLLQQDYTSIPGQELSFTFHCQGWISPLKFDLTDSNKICDLNSNNIYKLPSRVAVIIGRNGCGKSTLLARMARVMHGSAKNRERPQLQSLGKISPPGIGFPRIITISYSAFDSFQVPGISKIEKEQIIKDMESGEGRFIFCGLRDIAGELKQELAQGDFQTPHMDIKHNTLLKPIDIMANEFKRAIQRIARKKRSDIFESSLKILQKDPSFSCLNSTSIGNIIKEDPAAFFLSLSTGLKICIQVISEIVSHIEKRSILLFDEPETHLHPPLLASLMHIIRILLDRFCSFAIVATHSPILIQESLSKHVNIIRNEYSSIDVSPPTLETFGESIFLITSEVFGLSTNNTDYHATLRFLAKHYSINEIEDIFNNKGLSIQGRAFVMNQLSRGFE